MLEIVQQTDTHGSVFPRWILARWRFEPKQPLGAGEDVYEIVASPAIEPQRNSLPGFNTYGMERHSIRRKDCSYGATKLLHRIVSIEQGVEPTRPCLLHVNWNEFDLSGSCFVKNRPRLLGYDDNAARCVKEVWQRTLCSFYNK